MRSWKLSWGLLVVVLAFFAVQQARAQVGPCAEEPGGCGEGVPDCLELTLDGDQATITAIDTVGGSQIDLGTAFELVELCFGDAGCVLDVEDTLDTSSGSGVFTITQEDVGCRHFRLLWYF